MVEEKVQLEIEIGIDAKTKREVKEMKEDLEGIKQVRSDAEIQQEIEDELELEDENSVFRQSIAEDIDESLRDVIDDDVGDLSKFSGLKKEAGANPLQPIQELSKLSGQQLGNLSGFASNPLGSIIGRIQPFLANNPKILPIFGIFSVALAAPKVFQLIVQKLSAPGGPLDVRWRRVAKDEFQAGLTREAQKLQQTGRTLGVISQLNGYHRANEDWRHSNLYRVTESRISLATLDDKAAGLRLGRT